MTRRLTRPLALAAGALALAAGAAVAQQPPYQPPVSQQPPRAQYTPPVSPYLNILGRNGGLPAVNYYNFTQPFTQQQPYFQPQGQFFNAPPAVTQPLGEDVVLDPGTSLAPTGHPTAFNNLGGYFNTTTPVAAGRAPGQGRPGAAPGARR